MTHSLILECHHNGSMSALHRLRTEIQIQNNTNTHLKKEEGYNTKTHTSFHVTQVQLAKSSHAINGGAIFSAVSWSKSLPITVLGSCNILECDSKVFFRQNLFFCYCFGYCPNSMGFVDCICSN